MSTTFETTLVWVGDTQTPDYPRLAEVHNPGGAKVPVSSAPTFLGDPGRMNPEELLAAALSTCHMLFFLSLAHKARIQVTRYEDNAQATMVTEDKISRIDMVTLRPTIRVSPGTSQAKVEDLFTKAHKYCIIANSVACKVALEPRVVEG